MAGVTYCYQCKKILAETKTKTDACIYASIHMSQTPHIMVFGYSTKMAKKKGLI